MKKVVWLVGLIFAISFIGCGGEAPNLEFGENSKQTKPDKPVKPDNTPPPEPGEGECGGKKPCKCGHKLVRDRKMDGEDELENCECNGTTDHALKIANGAKLDCNGNIISAAIDKYEEYENEQPTGRIISEYVNKMTGIYIDEGSHGSSVKNCKIIGFREGILVQWNTNKITIADNKIKAGGDDRLMFNTVAKYGIIINGGWDIFERDAQGNIPEKQCSDITIRNNEFDTCDAYWGEEARTYYLEGTYTPPVGSWKKFFLGRGAYVEVHSGKNIDIKNNKFGDIGYGSGIILYQGPQDVKIIGNSFKLPGKRLPTAYAVGIKMTYSQYKGIPDIKVCTENTFYVESLPDIFDGPDKYRRIGPYKTIHAGIEAPWTEELTMINCSGNYWKWLDTGVSLTENEIPEFIHDCNDWFDPDNNYRLACIATAGVP